MPFLSVFKAKDFIVLLIVYFTLLVRSIKYCTKINSSTYLYIMEILTTSKT